MDNSFNSLPNTPAYDTPKKKMSTTTIIIIVVVVVLCCCCVATVAAGYWFWTNGDRLIQDWGMNAALQALQFLL